MVNRLTIHANPQQRMAITAVNKTVVSEVHIGKRILSGRY